MIEIKEDNAVITIYDDTDLSEFQISKFKKLVKMAQHSPNDFSEIHVKMAEMLEREKSYLEDDLAISGKKTYKQRLERIEKLKKILG